MWATLKLLGALLWLDVAVIIACGIASLIVRTVNPFTHFIIERDPALSYPYVTSQTVPMTLLGVFAVLLPLLALALYGVLGFGQLPSYRLKRALGTDRLPHALVRWVVLLGWVMAMLLSQLFTQCVKVYGGRPRPNFFAMCNYQGYNDALKSGNFTSYNALTVGTLSWMCSFFARKTEPASLACSSAPLYIFGYIF